MPLRLIVPMLLQVTGLLIACAVALVAWGALGFFGWLAVTLYLVGQELAPEVVDEDDTTHVRGR